MLFNVNYFNHTWSADRLYDLVVRFPGYRSRSLGFDSRRYQFFWVALGLERGPLSLVRKLRNYLKESLCWLRDTNYHQKLEVTSPTSGDISVGIVCFRVKKQRNLFFLRPTFPICWHVANFKKRVPGCKQWSRARFPTLSDFLRSSESGTTEELLERKSSGYGLENLN
jgi:hypothetical protein